MSRHRRTAEWIVTGSGIRFSRIEATDVDDPPQAFHRHEEDAAVALRPSPHTFTLRDFFALIALPYSFCTVAARLFSLPISELPDYRRRISSALQLPRFSAGAEDTQPGHLSAVFLCGCRQSCGYYLSFSGAFLPGLRPMPVPIISFEIMSENLSWWVWRTVIAASKCVSAGSSSALILPL